MAIHPPVKRAAFFNSARPCNSNHSHIISSSILVAAGRGRSLTRWVRFDRQGTPSRGDITSRRLGLWLLVNKKRCHERMMNWGSIALHDRAIYHSYRGFWNEMQWPSRINSWHRSSLSSYLVIASGRDNINRMRIRLVFGIAA